MKSDKEIEDNPHIVAEDPLDQEEETTSEEDNQVVSDEAVKDEIETDQTPEEVEAKPEEPEEPEEEVEDPPTEPKRGHKLTIFLVLILIVMTGLVAYLAREVYLMPKSPDKIDQIEATPRPTADLMLEESSASALPSKDSLKVQVLNGTGLAGQAGKIKTQVEDLGYSGVETGNGEATGEEATVAFSAKVSKELQKELISSLESTFEKVTTAELPDSSFDIVITTGTEK